MDAAENYEQAVKELEEIVSTLEKGDIPLEKSLELFQRGVALIKYCTGKLDETEKQILQIVEKDGVSSEIPWEPEAQK
ncbi:MAG TPA: exodeoxyribonuclease VII small subunit [Ruminiclostridium sp.]|jgi:exodeoxyribonuclease VII small subunit|nr:exodeoxyribonuclease VII small subunit [Clostridiaceae bacterium]HAA24903.1 exodeoxyribonuclease VII small subunit [Ruminiclostridium sp.]